MAGYKELDFNERRAASQRARDKSLAQLKARAPVNEAELTRRRANAEARDTALAEKRAAKKALLHGEETARAQQAEDEGAALPAGASQLTAEQRKAGRDAKYAARKKNKAKR